jgi:ankyrin repeat protein
MRSARGSCVRHMPRSIIARRDGHTALQMAALSNHTDMVQMLLDSGADVNEKDECVLTLRQSCCGAVTGDTFVQRRLNRAAFRCNVGGCRDSDFVAGSRRQRQRKSIVSYVYLQVLFRSFLTITPEAAKLPFTSLPSRTTSA